MTSTKNLTSFLSLIDQSNFIELLELENQNSCFCDMSCNRVLINNLLDKVKFQEVEEDIRHVFAFDKIRQRLKMFLSEANKDQCKEVLPQLLELSKKYLFNNEDKINLYNKCKESVDKLLSEEKHLSDTELFKIDEISWNEYIEKSPINDDKKNVLIPTINEIKKCIENNCEIASFVMIRRVLEIILDTFAETKSKNFRSLSDLIKFAKDEKLLKNDIDESLLDYIREYGNYIHAKKELKHKSKPSMDDVKLAYTMIKIIMKSLNNRLNDKS